jgi:Glycosyl transferases group 1
MRLLLWHVHGSWTTAFVQGQHEYVIPVLPDRGPDGRGRARTWTWPDTVVERAPQELGDIDVVVLQRPHELDLAREWTGRTDIPAVYVEHNAPEPHPGTSRHPLADRDDIPLVHVTNFNELYWDSGQAPTRVIEHGIVDPGPQYTGELPRVAVLINDPGRRGRLVGTDLLARFSDVAPLDLFGMNVDGLIGVAPHENLPQRVVHTKMARRRLYLHTARWTSLGLSLIEAMHLGMPVVAVAGTEAAEAVPSPAGVVSTDIARLSAAVRDYLNDPEAARMAGKAARGYALERYGLGRFLADWDGLLEEVTG